MTLANISESQKSLQKHPQTKKSKNLKGGP
jgi:hypothetical protein